MKPDEPASSASVTEFAAVDVCHAVEVGMEVNIDTSENKPADNSVSDSPATQEQSIQCSLPHQGNLHVVLQKTTVLFCTILVLKTANSLCFCTQY